MKGYLSDKDYNFIYSKSTRVCVDLFVESKEGVFIIKRKIEPYKDRWHLPGGRIRFRESISAAINRIAKEECGLRVYSHKLIGFMEFPREMQKGNKRHTVSLVFSVSTYNNSKKGKYFKKLPSVIHPVHNRFLVRNKLV